MVLKSTTHNVRKHEVHAHELFLRHSDPILEDEISFFIFKGANKDIAAALNALILCLDVCLSFITQFVVSAAPRR